MYMNSYGKWETKGWIIGTAVIYNREYKFGCPDSHTISKESAETQTEGWA